MIDEHQVREMLHRRANAVPAIVVDALRAVPAMRVDDLMSVTGATPELIERLVQDGLVSLEGERVALRA